MTSRFDETEYLVQRIEGIRKRYRAAAETAEILGQEQAKALFDNVVERLTWILMDHKAIHDHIQSEDGQECQDFIEERA